MLIIPWIFAVFGASLLNENAGAATKSVEVRGMVFAWQIEDDKLIGWLTAPVNGWLAVGFNTTMGLANTNLLMFSIENGVPEASDRYILKAGDHRPVALLGGRSAITLLKGQEYATHSTVHFEMNLAVADPWHHSLKKGQVIHLLLAYSEADDFQHHSIMRAHLEIEL